MVRQGADEGRRVQVPMAALTGRLVRRRASKTETWPGWVRDRAPPRVRRSRLRVAQVLEVAADGYLRNPQVPAQIGDAGLADEGEMLQQRALWRFGRAVAKGCHE